MSKLGNKNLGAATKARQTHRVDTGDGIAMAIEVQAAPVEMPKLNKMRKAELIYYAIGLGVAVSDSMTVKEIKEALGE